jgi:hypothetical protein
MPSEGLSHGHFGGAEGLFREVWDAGLRGNLEIVKEPKEPLLLSNS